MVKFHSRGLYVYRSKNHVFPPLSPGIIFCSIPPPTVSIFTPQTPLLSLFFNTHVADLLLLFKIFPLSFLFVPFVFTFLHYYILPPNKNWRRDLPPRWGGGGVFWLGEELIKYLQVTENNPTLARPIKKVHFICGTLQENVLKKIILED
jgi:hypothetical protein